MYKKNAHKGCKMNADEARKLVIKTHRLPTYIAKIKRAIKDGEKTVDLGKDTAIVKIFVEMGYVVESVYNNEHEGRVQTYLLHIPGYN